VDLVRLVAVHLEQAPTSHVYADELDPGGELPGIDQLLEALRRGEQIWVREDILPDYPRNSEKAWARSGASGRRARSCCREW
jgi:hypothetical protein